MGFVVVTVCFGASGVWYDALTQPGNLKIFQALYYVSTFFGQWGPNATTWCAQARRPCSSLTPDPAPSPMSLKLLPLHVCRLLPSELFPTEIRSTAHGIAASCGKLGALFAGRSMFLWQHLVSLTLTSSHPRCVCPSPRCCVGIHDHASGT